MPIDFKDAAIQFLLRQFERGDVVLFAGAGFSQGALNSVGQDPPLPRQLGELLCKECGWPYVGDELPIIYEQAEKHLGTKGLTYFLEKHYKNCKPSAWHSLIPQFCWRRIYTTNIDDVLERAYEGNPGQQRIDVVVCPAPIQEPDFFMERIACVHLHGSVLEPAKRITFSPDDFGRATATPNPWYQSLVDDMQARSVLFIGTKLNEAPFYHYLALREIRAGNRPESRARAFLVSSEISPVRRRNLIDQNIHPIVAPAEEFFKGLVSSFSRGTPQRVAILRALYPHQIQAIERQDAAAPSALLRQFDYIVPDNLPGADESMRSLFYMGAEPSWADIKSNIDAHRGTTKEVIDRMISLGEGLQCLVLTGYAGSGKSTTLRRAACELARNGLAVYFFKGEEKLDPGPLVDLARTIGKSRAVVFIDAAESQTRILRDLADRVPAEAKLLFVLAGRSHALYPRLGDLEVLKPQVHAMPELNREDTERILDKLKEFGFLGVLQGESRSKQIHSFLGRARKQLLVALREATAGRGFDAILAGEFASLADDQSRLAYTIVSLASMHGAAGVRRRHLLACLEGSDLERSRILGESLRDVVIPREGGSDLLAPRHRVIGQFVAVETAPLEVKIEAIKRLLTQIAADITPESIKRRVPEYITYRGIINCKSMLELFGLDHQMIVEMYESLRPFYGHDFLYWLQYGRAELEFGSYEIAENYLNQSIGIRADSHQSWHQMGVLHLKRATALYPKASAKVDAEKGEEILKGQIAARGDTDPYPYAALLLHKVRYLERAMVPNRGEQLGQLFNLSKVACEKHPFDEAVREASQHVFRAYLSLGVKKRTASP